MSLSASFIRKNGQIRTSFLNFAKDSQLTIQSIIDLNFNEETDSNGEKIDIWHLYDLLDSFDENYMHENDELLLSDLKFKTLFESLGYEVKSITYSGELVLRQFSSNEYQASLLNNENCDLRTSLILMALVGKNYDVYETLLSSSNLENLEIKKFLKILDTLHIFYNSEDNSFSYNTQEWL